MGRTFAARDPSQTIPDLDGKTFADAVAAAGVPGLTWQELAFFNWGTTEPAEVNRALLETVGCSAVDDADPSKTKLAPARGLAAARIYKPALWKSAAPLERAKTHTVTVKKRRPPAAIEIVSCPRWSPPGQAFAVEYRLEGLVARADKVDFEVHVSRYYAESDKGKRTDCGTEGPVGTTCLFRDRAQTAVGERAPSATQTYARWKGESKATAGVLKDPGAPEVKYVTHECAPYSVLLRYYADAADKDAKILLAPFFPRWKNGRVLDEASLVVSWKIDGDRSGKLKMGQLRVVDKDDKPVYSVALDKARLDKKSFDLLKEVPAHPIDKKLITRERMPYRVQIQAHSDGDEDKGLALATMHTAVKAMIYEKVRFVAFNIEPSATKTGDAYLGLDNDDDDIDARVAIMKKAIDAARQGVEAGSADKESVLKIFMAPEFYWRGTRGGYVQDKLSSIIPKMRAETDKFEYADWLFVFGTAIGYIEHSDKGAETKYEGWTVRPARVVSVDRTTPTKLVVEHLKEPGKTDTVPLAPHLADTTTALAWYLRQGAHTHRVVAAAVSEGKKELSAVTVDANPGFAPGPAELFEPLGWIHTVGTASGGETTLQVIARECARIPAAIGGGVWRVEQGTFTGSVKSCVQQGPGEFLLTLTAAVPGFAPGGFDLVEPPSLEVTNVALVQKGWPAPEPDDRVLKAASVFKEYVSWIDYLGPNYGDDKWDTPGGGGRKIWTADAPKVGGVGRTVLPTEGSRDVLAARPNAPPARNAPPTQVVTWRDKARGETHRVGSEINKVGDGGGGVFTIDDITFGLEVCLDHLQSRLAAFYRDAAVPGDPKVQIQLIPSWGASIGGGDLCTVPNGLVFNVDGASCASCARVADGATWSCDNHPFLKRGASGDCPACNKAGKKEPLRLMGPAIKAATGSAALPVGWKTFFAKPDANADEIYVYDEQPIPRPETM